MKRFGLAGTVSLWALLAAGGFAQRASAAAPADDPAEAAIAPAAADAAAGGDIVISGRRGDRAAELQRAPISITSLPAEKLAAQGITTVRDINNIVPNLFQTRTAVSYSNTTFFLRGVGEADAQGEPSVPLYVDGIYIPKTLGSQSELLDIERIEVFRGPQGHAFGHAAAGGAIAMTTTTPGEEAVFRAQASYGNYNDARLGFVAAGPIGDGVFASAAASYHRRDGFNRNVTLDRDTNDVDYLTGRAKLRFVPGDRWDIVLTASGVRDRSTARGVQDLLRGDRKAYNQVYPFNRFDLLAASAAIAYEIDDALTLRSLTGVYGFDQTAFYDNTGDFYGRGSQLVRYEDRTYQEELQLLGRFDRLDFTAGLYLYREEWFTRRRANIAAAPATAVPAAIRYRPVFTLIQQDTDNVAGYGQAAFRATDALTVTAGLRYNWERHTNDNQLFNLVATAPFQATAANFQTVIRAAPQALVWSVDVKDSWDTWSPRLALDYRWTPGILTYASVSRGTKSAGYDYRAQAASDAGRRQASVPFAPEKVTSYEAGIKSDWLDGRLRANLAVFHIDFADVQITATDPTPPDGGGAITRRFNAGKASTEGVEFEGSVTPFDNLTLDVNASYLKARLDRFTGTFTRTTFPGNAIFPGGFFLNNAPFSGATLAYSPKWQGRVAAAWTLPVDGAGRWVLNGDVSHQSAAFSAATNNFTERLPAQTYLNAQISYTTPDQRWTASVVARNLTNRHYAQGEGYAPDTAGLPIYRTTNYNDPRTIWLSISFRR